MVTSFLASWRILFSVELNYVIGIHETTNRKQSERMMIPKVEKNLNNNEQKGTTSAFGYLHQSEKLKL